MAIKVEQLAIRAKASQGAHIEVQSRDGPTVWYPPHWGTSRYIEVPWGTSRYIEVHWDTLRYIKAHWGKLKYLEVHRGTLRYIDVPQGTFRHTEVQSRDGKSVWYPALYNGQCYTKLPWQSWGGSGRYDTLRWASIRFSVNVQRAKPHWIYCIGTAKNTLTVCTMAQIFVADLSFFVFVFATEIYNIWP